MFCASCKVCVYKARARPLPTSIPYNHPVPPELLLTEPFLLARPVSHWTTRPALVDERLTHTRSSFLSSHRLTREHPKQRRQHRQHEPLTIQTEGKEKTAKQPSRRTSHGKWQRQTQKRLRPLQPGDEDRHQAQLADEAAAMRASQVFSTLQPAAPRVRELFRLIFTSDRVRSCLSSAVGV